MRKYKLTLFDAENDVGIAMDDFGNLPAVDEVIAVTGTNGGLVLAVADDPGMHSSQNEQDSRFYADFARVVCLEPANQQEAYDMTLQAFELSERKKLAQEVVKGRKGYYVIQFNQRKAPTMDEFDKEKAGIKEQLLQQKRFKAFQAWLDQRKKSSEIVIEEDFL